jgi:hypothetical protein
VNLPGLRFWWKERPRIHFDVSSKCLHYLASLLKYPWFQITNGPCLSQQIPQFGSSMTGESGNAGSIGRVSRCSAAFVARLGYVPRSGYDSKKWDSRGSTTLIIVCI